MRLHDGKIKLSACLICGKVVDAREPGVLVQRFTASHELGDAYYCAQHACRVRQSRSARRPFRLTPEERSAIFAGERPRIERQHDVPELEVGDLFELSVNVSIGITRKGKNKRGLVQYRYTVYDQRRDRPRLLRQNPPAHRTEHDKEDQRRPLTPALRALAAEQSAYTSSKLSAMPHEPENTDNPRALAAVARLRHAERIVEEIKSAA